MLLRASKSLRGTKSVSDAARELSLTLRHFDGPEALSSLMAGTSRRIVVLGRVPFALVIAAGRGVVSRSVGPQLIDKLLDFRNFS